MILNDFKESKAIKWEIFEAYDSVSFQFNSKEDRNSWFRTL
jgi:hypothetical protein